MRVINHQSLIDLMAHYQVDTARVAELLDRSPATVRVWRACSGANIPEKTYRYLHDRLQALITRYTTPPQVVAHKLIEPCPLPGDPSYYLIVKCPYCTREHQHGEGYGHRVSHCTGMHPDSHLGYTLIAEPGAESAA